MAERISRDAFFLEFASLVAMRSTCPRLHVGAVIVVDKRVVSMGYNGAPPGQPHCDEVGCRGKEYQDVQGIWKEYYPNGCTRATHAEANAVAFAARHGIPCAPGTMYCTHATCRTCAAITVAAGIERVVYSTPYRLTEGIELLEQCNVEVVHYGS